MALIYIFQELYVKSRNRMHELLETII